MPLSSTFFACVLVIFVLIQKHKTIFNLFWALLAEKLSWGIPGGSGGEKTAESELHTFSLKCGGGVFSSKNNVFCFSDFCLGRTSPPDPPEHFGSELSGGPGVKKQLKMSCRSFP